MRRSSIFRWRRICGAARLTAAEQHDRASHNISMLGRLKPGVSVAQARAELATIAHSLASDHPDTNENRTIQTVPLLDLVDETTGRFLLTLLVTAGFVLLLACANVANLLLFVFPSGSARSRFVPRWRQSRADRNPVLVESALIALIAGALGWISPPGIYLWRAAGFRRGLQIRQRPEGCPYRFHGRAVDVWGVSDRRSILRSAITEPGIARSLVCPFERFAEGKRTQRFGGVPEAVCGRRSRLPR